jgi:hypothetical protein
VAFHACLTDVACLSWAVSLAEQPTARDTLGGLWLRLADAQRVA